MSGKMCSHCGHGGGGHADDCTWLAAMKDAIAAPMTPRYCPACQLPLARDDTHWSLSSGPAGGYVCPADLTPRDAAPATDAGRALFWEQHQPRYHEAQHKCPGFVVGSLCECGLTESILAIEAEAHDAGYVEARDPKASHNLRPLGECRGCHQDRRHVNPCCPDCDCFPESEAARPAADAPASEATPEGRRDWESIAKWWQRQAWERAVEPGTGLTVDALARILRDANIGCEDHHDERDTGDRRQHRIASHREDAAHILRAIEAQRASKEDQ